MPPRRRRSTRKRTTARSAAPKPAPLPPQVGPGERLWILDVPYAERGFASAGGATWNGALRQTIYVGERLPHALTPYVAPAFSWPRFLEDDFNGNVTPPPPQRHTFTPRPHQVEATDTIVKAAKAGARGFLLADDVGVGKTISAWNAVRELSQVRPVRNVLVVCPLAVVPHWRRTITDLGADGMRVVVINYDRLKSLLEVPAEATAAKRKSTQNRRTAKSGISIVDWDVVVLDEAHKLRNSTSQRSQAASRLAGYHLPREDAAFVLWMTATAGQNPTELSYMAPLLAQVTKSRASELKDFGPWLENQGFHVTHESRFDKWAWTDDPRERTADIKKMKALLFDRSTPVALRRLPTDIAGWPEVQRILLPVDLDPEGHRLYEQAWTEFRREMHLVRRGTNPTAGMVARLRFRQKASLVRVDGTVEHALDLLENGHQVAISIQFLESLDRIAEKLQAAKAPVTIMDGRDPSGREAARLAFQTGKARVALFTPVEGFSLHAEEVLPDGSRATSATRSLIVHDVRYSGLEALQLEGRCHRDSQAANAYYAFSTDTVEEEVVGTLISRIESTKALVGDDTTLVKALEALLERGPDPVLGEDGDVEPAEVTSNPRDNEKSRLPAALPPEPGAPAVAKKTAKNPKPVLHPKDPVTQYDNEALRRRLQGR